MVMVVSVLADFVDLDSLNASWLSRQDVHDALAKTARVQSWLDARKAWLARRLHDLSADSPSIIPEADIATATRCTRREADQAMKRAAVLGDVPEMEAALADGDVTSGHVDALGRAIGSLKPELRSKLTSHGSRLAEIAARSTPEQFERTLKLEVSKIDTSDGGDRLARQKQAIRLRTWLDRETGMLKLLGSFDPESALKIVGRLDLEVERLFHDKTPDGCPEGDAKQDYLRALAFLHLLDAGRIDTAGREIDDIDQRVEVSIVIDYETFCNGRHDLSRIDNGSGAELPVESYRRMACLAAIFPMVTDHNGNILNHGRQRRLASREQRRALKAMYRTCAIPGCTVASRYCEPHHIIYWERDGGDTDLDNLLPLCSRHHHNAHEGGWKLRLAPDRNLTITYPDGTIQTTGPPGRQTAA